MDLPGWFFIITGIACLASYYTGIIPESPSQPIPSVASYWNNANDSTFVEISVGLRTIWGVLVNASSELWIVITLLFTPTLFLLEAIARIPFHFVYAWIWPLVYGFYVIIAPVVFKLAAFLMRAALPGSWMSTALSELETSTFQLSSPDQPLLFTLAASGYSMFQALGVGRFFDGLAASLAVISAYAAFFLIGVPCKAISFAAFYAAHVYSYVAAWGNTVMAVLDGIVKSVTFVSWFSETPFVVKSLTIAKTSLLAPIIIVTCILIGSWFTERFLMKTTYFVYVRSNRWKQDSSSKRHASSNEYHVIALNRDLGEVLEKVHSINGSLPAYQRLSGHFVKYVGRASHQKQIAENIRLAGNVRPFKGDASALSTSTTSAQPLSWFSQMSSLAKKALSCFSDPPFTQHVFTRRNRQRTKPVAVMALAPELKQKIPVGCSALFYPAHNYGTLLPLNPSASNCDVDETNIKVDELTPIHGLPAVFDPLCPTQVASGLQIAKFVRTAQVNSEKKSSNSRTHRDKTSQLSRSEGDLLLSDGSQVLQTSINFPLLRHRHCIFCTPCPPATPPFFSPLSQKMKSSIPPNFNSTPPPGPFLVRTVSLERYRENEIQLAPSSEEYERVEKAFLKTAMGCRIRSISKLVNDDLYELYEAKKRIMARSMENVNEALVFHGTNKIALEKVKISGFNRSFAGQQGTAYGHGTYFARDAIVSVSYSRPDSKGIKYMFAATVLLGRSGNAHNGLKSNPLVYSAHAVEDVRDTNRIPFRGSQEGLSKPTLYGDVLSDDEDDLKDDGETSSQSLSTSSAHRNLAAKNNKKKENKKPFKYYDSAAFGNIVVIFHDAQALPKYIIEFVG